MNYTLYIDELGESPPQRYAISPYYIITGVAVDDRLKKELICKLDHIKFKYWDSTEVVFHSANIGRKDKDFAIFKNDLSLFHKFTRNLEKYLNDSHFFVLSVTVDQSKANKLNWTQKNVIKNAYREIFENYIRFLMANNATGQIIQEASTPIQDITIYENFFHFQTNGIPLEGITHANVKERLTGVAFYTKRDGDTISQISDLLAYGIKCEILEKSGTKSMATFSVYEKMIKAKATSKLFNCPPTTGTKKLSYYKNINPMRIIP